MGWPASGEPGGTPGYYDDNGGSFVADLTVVPEPASLGLLICAATILVGRRRQQPE